jgi:hypothetical protein
MSSSGEEAGGAGRGAGDLSTPKQASRSVSLLTPEQLQKKRVQDRESQKQTRQVNTRPRSPLKNQKLTAHRARIKQTIAELEKRVESLTQELHLARQENTSLRQKNQLAPSRMNSDINFQQEMHHTGLEYSSLQRFNQVPPSNLAIGFCYTQLEYPPLQGKSQLVPITNSLVGTGKVECQGG